MRNVKNAIEEDRKEDSIDLRGRSKLVLGK